MLGIHKFPEIFLSFDDGGAAITFQLDADKNKIPQNNRRDAIIGLNL